MIPAFCIKRSEDYGVKEGRISGSSIEGVRRRKVL
jgi:hypothetical protein